MPPRREGDLLLPLAAAVCIFLGWYVFLDYEQAAMIVAALKKTAGIQKDAARLLGVSPKNLWNKIQKHRIEPADYAT